MIHAYHRLPGPRPAADSGVRARTSVALTRGGQVALDRYPIEARWLPLGRRAGYPPGSRIASGPGPRGYRGRTPAIFLAAAGSVML
jgi:hypothetical protein